MEQVHSKAYNCDCLEYMRSLPDNYFDLAIADPPYGIGASRPSKKAERARQADGSVLQVPVTDFTKKDWDDTIPSQEFFDELRRVSRNQIIWGANYFGLQGGMIVWDKINGNSDQYDCEIAYQSFNKRTDLVHYMWNGMFQGKYCGRDIRQAAVQQGNKALNEKRIHPTQKPVILYEWLMNNYAKKGDRIFDPMMGSQSSRIAAHRLGFDYVGCELDKEYYEKGCLRFHSEQMKNNKGVTNNNGIMDKKSSMETLAEKIKTSSYWTDVEENNFPDKVIFNNSKERLANGEKILCFDCEWEEVGNLHVVSFSNPNKRNLFVTENGFLVNSKVHTSTFKPAYLTFEKTDTKVFDTAISQDQQKELSEAKSLLMKTLDSARADLGDTILIKPTPVKLAGSAFAKATGVFLAPDGEGGGEFRLAGEYYAVLAVESNGHTEFDVTKILDNVSSVNALTKAVHDAHVIDLEQKSKQTIHDRIVTPTARSFTPDQVETLNHYHQVAAPDKPAGEVFSRLLDEVAHDPDVARKPEKWVTDAAKELNNLAEGITREWPRSLTSGRLTY